MPQNIFWKGIFYNMEYIELQKTVNILNNSVARVDSATIHYRIYHVLLQQIVLYSHVLSLSSHVSSPLARHTHLATDVPISHMPYPFHTYPTHISRVVILPNCLVVDVMKGYWA